MNFARTLALASTLLPLAAWADAAAANKKLSEALSTLNKAVERIKVDPPSNADLDAALTAVNALKDAIEAGAEFEGSDLDYAKAALGARKEQRTQREYIEDRRAKVKIFDARRAIDAALKSMLEEVKALEANKDPAAGDYTGARTAASLVKKALDDNRAFGKQDKAFDAYVTQTDAAVTKANKQIDDKEVAVGTDKRKAALDAARAPLKEAVGKLNKQSQDDDFKGADKALADLNKNLEDGKALEGKSPKYKAEADKARAEATAAKKKMDEIWTATGLQRLKAEIDPQFKDMLAAGKPVKAGKPTADQLAEAKTACIVVRKLLEKFKDDAERSQAFGNYVAGVKKELLDIEGKIEQRTLAAAQAEVAQAQKKVEGKNPSDDDFAQLDTACTVLEKTFDVIHKDEATMANFVALAQAQLVEARAARARRRTEVDVERQKAKVEDARKIVAEALNGIKVPKPGKELIDAAVNAVKLLGTTLDAGKALAEQDKGYAAYDKEVRLRIREGEDKIDQRLLTMAQSEVYGARKKVEAKAPSDGEFDEFKAATDILEKQIASVHKDEKSMEAAIKDAQWALKEARQVHAKRRLEVDIDRQKAKVEDARKIAADAIKAASVPKPTNELIEASVAAVKLVGTTLDAGKDLVGKDKGYAFYDAEVRKRLKELDGTIGQRRVVLGANDAKDALLTLVGLTKEKIAVADKPDGKDSDVDAAQASVDALNKMLETNVGIEKQNPGYAAAADKVRNVDGYKIIESMDMAKFSRELRKKSGDQYAEAGKAVDEAAANPKLRARKGNYDKAISLYKACQTESNLMLSMYPVLVKIPVAFEGGTKAPRDVIAACGEKLTATEQLLKDLAPLISFDEGPKKSYESAKGLLEKGKKPEALKQFNECIATGVILQQRNPEMKDKQFQVAGSTITLGELVQVCQNQQKTLKGK